MCHADPGIDSTPHQPFCPLQDAARLLERVVKPAVSRDGVSSKTDQAHLKAIAEIWDYYI
jgi:hypothetical protein